MEQFEFFGNDSQVKLQQRYYRLWQYLKAHPRLSFVGRAIGLDDPALDEVGSIAGLTMELGFLALAFTKATIVDELSSALEEHGLEVGIWQHLLSNEKTESRCESVMASRRLPPGYRVDRITTTAPEELVHSFQKMMHRCDVAPLPGYILRGQEVPVVAEMILDPQDEVVATGVSIFRHNPEGPYGKAAHVGFLATEPSQRGKGFAQLLLARIILASYQENSAELLHTGVRAENIPSQRVCQSCGLEDSGMYFLGVAHPQKLERAQFTR
ncbi:MAG: GNAT family N-acetyltransferase [Chloroflexota bacterium]|nr:MAG: GNAT family N-acetyltransferase [Chloroflexota bacterium]